MKRTYRKVLILFLALTMVISQCFEMSAFAVSDLPGTMKDFSSPGIAPYYREDGTYVEPMYKKVNLLYKDGVYTIEYINEDGTVDHYGYNESFKIVGNQLTVLYDGRPHPTDDYSLKSDDATTSDGFIIGKGKILDLNTLKKVQYELPNDNILKKYTGKGGNVIIPNGVQVIGPSVFEGRTDITSVTIPDSVLYIEGDAFENTGLTSLNLHSALKTVKGFAFAHCKNLKYAIIQGDPSVWNGTFFDTDLVVYSDSKGVKAYRSSEGLRLKPLSQAPVAKGTLTVDTTNYFLTPNSTYEIGTLLTGYGITLAASSNNSNVAKVTGLGNGKWKVSGVKAGCTSIIFGIYKGNKQIACIPVLVTVQSGISPHGDSTKRTVNF